MTQSIIVYRNPIEAAFWEGVSTGALFPIMVGVVIFFAVFLTANAAIVERYFSWNNRTIATNVNLAVSALLSAAVVYKMWI